MKPADLAEDPSLVQLLEEEDASMDALVAEFPEMAERFEGAKPGGDDSDSDADDKRLEQLRAAKKELPKVDHSTIEYEAFRKNFYIEAPDIKRLSDEEVEAFREEMDRIKVRGKRVPKPIKKWTQCGLSDRVLGVIERAGYKAPFPIQAQALPCIMSGRDVIAVARTGSAVRAVEPSSRGPRVRCPELGAIMAQVVRGLVEKTGVKVEDIEDLEEAAPAAFLNIYMGVLKV